MDQEKLIKTWKILEALTVSLDRIGSLESDHGREAVMLALYEYFSAETYRDIAVARRYIASILVSEDPAIESTLEEMSDCGSEINYWKFSR